VRTDSHRGRKNDRSGETLRISPNSPLTGAAQTWKKRWFVLSNNCLYYFKKKEDEEKDRPCGYIPLENLSVKEVVKAPRKNCFMIYHPDSKELKVSLGI
jgi:cytohesin